MTASGDVLYLPILSPVRSPFPDFSLRPHLSQDQPRNRPHRIYRVPEYNRQRLAYSQTGHAVILNETGKLIDTYA